MSAVSLNAMKANKNAPQYLLTALIAHSNQLKKFR